MQEVDHGEDRWVWQQRRCIRPGLGDRKTDNRLTYNIATVDRPKESVTLGSCVSGCCEQQGLPPVTDGTPVAALHLPLIRRVR